jgi:hypothetical protein
MPPPACGKGNAYRRDFGVNEKFVELARNNAQAVAAAASRLDPEDDRKVLQIVTSSALKKERKDAACIEVRKALKVCRKGIDPKEEAELTHCKHAGCSHEHVFLCLTRGVLPTTRKPTEPERSVAEAVWTAIGEYLRTTRAHLLPLVRFK